MEDEDFSKHIPNNIRKFRYENSFTKVLNPEQENAGILMKNIKENQHFHFFQKNGQPDLVLTVEKTKDGTKRHIPIDYSKFLLSLGQVWYEWWKIIERIEISDPKFIGKRIVLVSPPKISLEKIKKKTAYLAPEFAAEELYFEEMDVFQSRFGAIYDDMGKETHMVFTRNGEIFVTEIRKLDEIIKGYESKITPTEFLKN